MTLAARPMPTEAGYGLFWWHATLSCDHQTCPARLEQVANRVDATAATGRLLVTAAAAGWSSGSTADLCPVHRWTAPLPRSTTAMPTPPPVDEPIGPPLPVRTARTTPTGVEVDVVIDSAHPAYATLVAGALNGCTIEALTGAPGTDDQDQEPACRWAHGPVADLDPRGLCPVCAEDEA